MNKHSHNNRNGKENGFSLIEVLLAVVIMSLAVLSLLAASAAFTQANSAGTDLSTAEFLIEQIRELTAMLPVIDPDPGAGVFGPEEAALADYDDVDDFLNATFSPPISASRLPLNDFSQFSQHVTVQTIEPANLEQVSATHKGFVRVTVTVSINSREISSANWIRATH